MCSRRLWVTTSDDISQILTRKQGLEKIIPDAPKGQIPVHLRDRQIYAENKRVVLPWEKDVGIRKDGKPDQTKTDYYRPEKDSIPNASPITPTA